MFLLIFGEDQFSGLSFHEDCIANNMKDRKKYLLPENGWSGLLEAYFKRFGLSGSLGFTV